jgi:hypothetical protein
LNIRRKGLRAAMTATLLSSLLATVAAPAAFGAVTWPDTGSTTPNNGPSDNVALQLTENSASCLLAGGDTNGVRISIFDSSGAPTLRWQDAGLPSGPGSLGVTTSLSSVGGGTNNRLDISWAASDTFNVEQINVTSLEFIDPAGGGAATTGAVQAFMTGTSAGCFRAGGAAPGDFGTTTASGQLAGGGYPAGTTAFNIILNAGSCDFQVSGVAGSGPLQFLVNPETKNITVAPPSALGTQGVTTVASANAHAGGEAVTQTISANPALCPTGTAIASPGSIVAGFALTASTQTFVLPGENNQPGGTATWTSAGSTTLFGTQTLTFTITAPAGVRFSAPPTVVNAAGNVVVGSGGVCSLSIDRRSCTVPITSDAAGGPDAVRLTNVLLDVDATVPLGSPVTVTLSTSGGTPVTGGAATIAFVARVIIATAAQPTIFIGVNDQESGMITLSESMPGFFAAGLGSNNTFGLCLVTGETFTRAPWAVVTTGNLQLLSGFVGAQSVKGTLYNGGQCAYWTVFSASTGVTPSVIEIRGSANDTTPLASGANNGPRLSVPGSLAPGTTQIQVRVGQQAGVVSPIGNTTAVVGLVSNATRAFRAGPIVAAVSQPLCQPGSTDCLGGNITITEQFNGQLKAGSVITVRILPRATVQRQDVILRTGVTNDLPIVTTNAASGLLVTPINVICPPSALLGITLCQFTFVVSQQSFGPTLGQITISNIHYIVAADAVNGPVLVEVSAPGAGSGGPAGSQAFDAVVSNATIGPPPATPVRTSLQNGTLAGVVKVSEGRTFTAATKIVPVGSYCTWQADMDPAASGERVGVWIAKRSLTSPTWSAFTQFSTRAVNSQGLAVFHYDNADQPGWVSVRFSFAGNAAHGPATSLARQCVYRNS